MGIPIGFQKSSVHETLTGSELEFVSVFLLPHPTKSQSKIVSSVQGANLPEPAGEPNTNKTGTLKELHLIQFGGQVYGP